MAMVPHERSLVKKMEGKPFVLLGVNNDQSREVLKKVVATQKMTWRSFFDGPNRPGPIGAQWQIRGWPSLYLIDAGGTVRAEWVGNPGEKVLDEAIDKLVRQVE